MNEQRVFGKVHLKYLILRVRAKISYMAFEKRMTVLELFASTILRCYEDLMRVGAIPALSATEKRRHQDVVQKLSSGSVKGFTYAVGEFNVSNLQVFDVRFLERVLQHAKISEPAAGSENERLVNIAKEISNHETCLDLFRDFEASGEN